MPSSKTGLEDGARPILGTGDRGVVEEVKRGGGDKCPASAVEVELLRLPRRSAEAGCTRVMWNGLDPCLFRVDGGGIGGLVEWIYCGIRTSVSSTAKRRAVASARGR